jgi:hypothetical protein
MGDVRKRWGCNTVRFGDAAPCNGARCEFPHSAFGCRISKTASKRKRALRCASLSLFFLVLRTRSAETIARSLLRHPTESDKD